VFQHHGADATRWYLLSATAPWQDKRFFDGAVRDTYGKFFSTLWNTFLFANQYAELDHWKPTLATLDRLHDIAKDAPLDRWLLSRLEATVADALEHGNKFHLHKATRAIEEFVVGDLSNWWVRRSRDRFWQDQDSADKQSAHATLWWALHSVCRLVAPFAPFMVEHIWEHVRLPEDPDSVHLARYPVPGERDEGLEGQMKTVRAICEDGRALRSRIGIPTRHPLEKATLIDLDFGPLNPIIQEELNVKSLNLGTLDDVADWHAVPMQKELGPRFKQHAPQAKAAIEALDGRKAMKTIQSGGKVAIDVAGETHLVDAEVMYFEDFRKDHWRYTSLGDFEKANDKRGIALWTERSQDLLDEAFAREVIRRVQDWRKELDLGIEETISLRLDGASRLAPFLELVKEECRLASLELGEVAEAEKEWEIDGSVVRCAIASTR